MATSYGTDFYITSVLLPEHYSPEHHTEFTEDLRERAEALSLVSARNAYANAIGCDADSDEEARQAVVEAVDVVLNSDESNVTINEHAGRWVLVVVATGDGGGSTDGWGEMDGLGMLLNARLLDQQ